MPSPTLLHRHLRPGVVILAATILSVTALAVWYMSGAPAAPGHGRISDRAELSITSGPPWIYGQQADARFVVTMYADLECPYCKDYFPVLRSWIDRHPQVELQWLHLPLAFHEPAATRLAVTAECMGMVAGQAAFWDTVAWIFQHTNGGGRGLPENLTVPGMMPTVEACIGADEPKEAVQAQAQHAAQEGIDATPTLKLADRTTGKELVLAGAVEDDALLSALDLLSAEEGGENDARYDLPAGDAGMPR